MRRGPSLKRKPEPDPIYNSLLVSQLVNQVLLDGKKDLASNIVYSALELVEKQSVVALSNIPDRPGIAAELFEALSEGGVNVDLIIQATHQINSNDFKFLTL